MKPSLLDAFPFGKNADPGSQADEMRELDEQFEQVQRELRATNYLWRTAAEKGWNGVQFLAAFVLLALGFVGLHYVMEVVFK